MKPWIKVGDRVRYIHPKRPMGDQVFGEGDPVAWLCIGAEGTVTELHEGYPAHPCPDHSDYPDCICGDEGTVPAMSPWAVVEYESDIPGRKIKRAIQKDAEGEGWERVS